MFRYIGIGHDRKISQEKFSSSAICGDYILERAKQNNEVGYRRFYIYALFSSFEIEIDRINE